MPRKQKKYHYIYKTTCVVTKKYYVGMHSTNELNDGYIGSGKRLWYSINKYGRKNHTIKILEYYENRSSLKLREKELVNEDLLQDPMCMNLTTGGEGGGGIWNKDHADKFHKAGGRATRQLQAKRNLERAKSDSEFRKKWNDSISKSLIGNPKLVGRKHSDSTKKKISESAKLKIGSKNSQYGTCWIYNNKESIKIKGEDLDYYLTLGWIKGRKLKF